MEVCFFLVTVKTEAAGINVLFYCFCLGVMGGGGGGCENVSLGSCRRQLNKGYSSALGRGRDQMRQ